MELVTMTKQDFDKAIAAQTAVSMALDYLAECEGKPDAEWLRFILMGCPVTDLEAEILREEDCPEEPRTHKKGHPVLEHLMPDGEHDLEQI